MRLSYLSLSVLHREEIRRKRHKKHTVPEVGWETFQKGHRKGSYLYGELKFVYSIWETKCFPVVSGGRSRLPNITRDVNVFNGERCETHTLPKGLHLGVGFSHIGSIALPLLLPSPALLFPPKFIYSSFFNCYGYIYLSIYLNTFVYAYLYVYPIKSIYLYLYVNVSNHG